MLQFKELHKRFGEVIALDGVSFSVPQGSITGFVGRNGAGKSTTMRSVFGLVNLDSGSITWNGRQVTPADQQRFGFMPEQRGLYKKMPIGEQVSFFGRLKGMSPSDAQASARHWLERFGLTDRIDEPLEKLSYGNQQRVQLSVAIVNDPELLVLDEPFNGLDPSAVELLESEMRQLVADGTTILLSSHQLDLVEDICERAVFVDRGRIVQEGTVTEIRQSAGRNDVTIDFAGAPSWGGLIAAGVSMVSTTSGRVENAAADQLEGILRQALEAGPVTEFRYEPPSLSEVFAEVTK